jgi:MYXO-CTERM domain-containing protein
MTEVIAGDQNRAAVTFLGSTTAGDDAPETFPGVWYLYVAFTYDGGQTWQTVNAIPGDIIQRGGICTGGVGCGTNADGSTSRNMLDFNDETIDNHGRVQIAYTDGCTASCKANPNAAVCQPPNATGAPNPMVCTGRNSSVFTMANQVCGMGLLALYDPGFNNDPSCSPVQQTPESPVTTALVVTGGAIALAVAFAGGRRRRRRGAPQAV